jgi:F0F1-type ATP synthase membrane subunit b/b'
MSTQEPAQSAPLTSLPRLEDIPQVEGGGYDPDGIRDAFDAFRRHALQLQAQLRVLQAAGRTANVDPTGHVVRMDALHLIRGAAEFADALERDAQNASAAQLGRTEEEVRRRQRELQEREGEIERYRDESEKQRTEILTAANNEARELLAAANRDATAELRESEARGARLLEQSRHQATELTNAARAEVEQTLEWARAQGAAIMARAQQGAEQLLTAAGLGPEALTEVSNAIVEAARAATEASRARTTPTPATPAIAPVPEPEPEPDEPEAEAPSEEPSAEEELSPQERARRRVEEAARAAGIPPSDEQPSELPASPAESQDEDES